MAEQKRSEGSRVLAALAWKWREHWVLTVFPDAPEASGTWRKPGVSAGGLSGESEPDPGRSAFEAARRARVAIRRYCAANQLNRLGTLTYAGDGQHDPDELRADVAA